MGKTASAVAAAIAILVVALSAFAVWDGRNAEALTADTYTDVVSVCVRGVWRGEDSARSLPGCIRGGMWVVDQNERWAKLMFLEREVDEGLVGLERSRKALEPYTGHPSPQRDN